MIWGAYLIYDWQKTNDLTPSEVPLAKLLKADGLAEAPPAKNTIRSAKNTSTVSAATVPVSEQLAGLV